MSHVVQIELEIKDLDALAKSAEQLGLELVRGQQTYKWYGHSVGDYPIPNGFTANDLGKCEHALRVKGNPRAYEIGLVRTRGKVGSYTMLWDFYGGGFGLQEKVGDDAVKLQNEYAAQVSMRQMQRKGYRVSIQRKDDQIILDCV